MPEKQHSEKPTFTLGEIVDLERPARHTDASGAIDYHYDGINFWCGEGQGCPVSPEEELPREGWRHMPACRCQKCREARGPRRPKRPHHKGTH
jgi:hypothetical protein